MYLRVPIGWQAEWVTPAPEPGAGSATPGEPAGGAELASVAAELYALPPGEFTAARDERAAAARAAGQRDLAGELRRLRRPTLSAWAVNLLALRESGALADLAELAEELRDAQANRRGDQLRQLFRRRQEVLAGLVALARRLVADGGHQLGDDAAQQVERTLTAALSDPDALQQVRSGRLVSPLEYAGFGELLPGQADGPAAAPAGTPPPAATGTAPTRAAGAAPAQAAPEATSARERQPTPGRRQPARPAGDPQARLRGELATAEQELAEATERARQAQAELAEAEQDRQRTVDRRDELRRELRQADRDHLAAEARSQAAARRAAGLDRTQEAAQRRVDQLRTRLSEPK
jgi:hypothetical protein